MQGGRVCQEEGQRSRDGARGHRCDLSARGNVILSAVEITWERGASQNVDDDQHERTVLDRADPSALRRHLFGEREREQTL